MKNKLALLFLISISLLSCKKGDDDPFVSLKSRTGRLEGDWVLKSAFLQGKYDNPRESQSNFVFKSDGAKFSLEFPDTAALNVEGPHQLLIHFDKDGQLQVRETFFSEGYNLIGTWDFLHKSDEAKNKERIMLVPEEVVSGNSSDFHPLFFPSMERIYHLRELRNDKLVMVYEGEPYIEKGGETLHLKAEFLFGR